MKCKFYVVSLADETTRRENIKKQFERKKLEFEFVDAIDMRSASEDVYEKHVSYHLKGAFGRSLTNGEVGCALSHLKVYNVLMSDAAGWACVIEDDAELDRLDACSVNNIISYIESSGLDIDVVILGYSKLAKEDESLFYRFEPVKELIKFDSYSLGRPWKNWTCGTVSYLISNSGVKKMRDYFSDGKIITAADDWHFFEDKVGLNITHHRPLLVFEDFINFQSSLELDRAKVSKKKKNYLDKIRILRGYLRGLLMRL